MRRWNDVDLKGAVTNSTSIAEVLRLLNLKAAGGNYRTIKDAIERLQLDTSHFTGQRSSYVGMRPRKRARTLDEVLVPNSPTRSTSHLRLRLLKEGIFQHQCNRCGLREWEGYPIPLELEHIDGDSSNNSLKNLCVLCPNCHALTPTYRGRNIGK